MPSEDIVADSTGFSRANTARYWPMIVAALEQEGIGQEPVQIAAAATLKAELGTSLLPVTEYHPAGVNAQTYFENKYGYLTSVGKKLGNIYAGDGYKFRGRGFIQLTGRSNYTAYGNRLGIPLTTSPDLALEPNAAARIFAAYFKDRGVAAAAMNADWRKVRLLVNGGYNGWDKFSAVVTSIVQRVVSPSTPLPSPTTPFLPDDKMKPLLALTGFTLLALVARRWL